jgi:hypothetical protein
MFQKLNIEDNVSYMTHISQLPPLTTFSRFPDKYEHNLHKRNLLLFCCSL